MKKNKEVESKDKIPQSIHIRFSIKPAFMVEIVEDSTGKKWNGHYTFGRTAREALRTWRSALQMKNNEPYASANLTFTAVDASMVGGISWQQIVTKED